MDQNSISVQTCPQVESIEPHIETWLISMKKIWATGIACKISEYLFQFFLRAENPYMEALKAMRHCGDFYSGKKHSLASYIMEFFSIWLKIKENSTAQNILCNEIKKCAFNLVIQQKNQYLVNLVFQNYKLLETNMIFVSSIKDLVSKQKFKEACQYATMLNLYNEFDIKDFVIPLVIQDRFSVAENFIKSKEQHQIDLVTFLDSVLCKVHFEQNLKVKLRNLNIMDVDTSHFHWKACSKLIIKLIQTYNLDESLCPNFEYINKSGTLQFLMNKRFVEKTIGLESWEELILDIVGSNEDLQVLVVVNVLRHGCPQEALMWAQKFQIPEIKWPDALKHIKPNDSKNLKTHFSKRSDFEKLIAKDKKKRCAKFHKLCISENKIHFIDEKSIFYKFLNEVVPKMKLVGLDSEWKPVFGTKTNNISLLQVATDSDIYILDIKTLKEKTAPAKAWKRLEKNLFCNRNILKLGFDIKNDFLSMKEICSEFKQNDIIENGILDLKFLWKELVEKHNFQFPFSSSANSSKNLNTLVELCLGKKLDKSDQLSNWEKRPLRRSQIIYAALDAYCLIEVYNVLCRERKRQNISSPFIDKYLLDETTKQKSASKIQKNYGLKPVRPSLLQFKIVCGPMLYELGNEFRRYGATTFIWGRDQPQNFFKKYDGKPTILFTQARKVENCKIYTKIFWIFSQGVNNQFLEALKCLKVKPPKIPLSII